MIEMTPTTKAPVEILIWDGVAMLKRGVSIEAVMLHMERDPIFQQISVTKEQLRKEIEFWGGKPKK